jgi:threonine dehydratase
MIEIGRFEEARARIAPFVRKTSLVRLRTGDVPAGVPDVARGVREAPIADLRLGRDLWLKLESEQVSGSFKARGALNRVLSLPRDVARRGVVTASGGNHGLAIAYAGRVVDAPTTVFLPRLTPPSKAARIERWGARVVRVGEVWDDAHAAAVEHASASGRTYVHPFADADVIAGQGTIALELFEQEVAPIDLLVVAIGGGGLIAGVAAAAKAVRPHLHVVGVEPVGAPTLERSLRANAVVELPEIRTAAGTLAPRRSHETNLAIIRDTVDRIVLVTDDEMRDAARFLLVELGVGAELSGAAAVAAVLAARIDLRDAMNPCALVCGAGDGALA